MIPLRVVALFSPLVWSEEWCQPCGPVEQSTQTMFLGWWLVERPLLRQEREYVNT